MIRALARRLGLRRDRMRAARVLASRRARTMFSRPRPRLSGRILCYHGVGTPAWGYNDVSPGRFRRQLELALSRGYRFVPAEAIACGGGGPKDLAITFDDGLRSVADRAAPILEELGIPWTVFVVTSWADGRGGWLGNVFLGWDQLRELARGRATLGSHSVTHSNFGRLSLADAWRELKESRATIAERTGVAVSSFAVPFGQSRDWSVRCSELARDAGYGIVYAQTEDRHLLGTVPRTFITGFDDDPVFLAALNGAFDSWEE